MDALTLFAAVVRGCLFAGILVSLGAVAFRWLVLPRSGEADPRAARAGAVAGATAAILLLPTLVALFGLQLAAFRDPMAPLSEDMSLLLSLGWGRVWMVQVSLALLLLLSFTFAVGGRPLPWIAATLLALGLGFTPALSGHASSVPNLVPLAIAADGLHVASAGTWVGTLFVLTVVCFRSPPSPAPVFLARIQAFSPVALGCAVVIVTTGTFGAFLHLHHLAELWTTPYGRALSLKLLLFAGVVILGAYNWRRATPRLRAGADPSQMARSIYAEIGMAALVVLVTAWFVATAPPEVPA
ncbi:MAG: hypothetical protein GEU90_10575 [Gemmatimonas sp.]|nr:hypothetical protein [Gemmatimonas sp.]